MLLNLKNRLKSIRIFCHSFATTHTIDNLGRKRNLSICSPILNQFSYDSMYQFQSWDLARTNAKRFSSGINQNIEDLTNENRIQLFSKKFVWSPELDQRLIDLVEKHRETDDTWETITTGTGEKLKSRVRGRIAWKPVTEEMGFGLKPRQCRLRFANYVDPVYANRNFGPWNDEEVTHLLQLCNLYPRKWNLIGEIINRRPICCHNKYQAIQRIKMKKGFFTAEEDEIILGMVETDQSLKTGIWTVLEQILNRPSGKVQRRWRVLTKRNKKTSPIPLKWTTELDEELQKAVNKHGIKNWQAVSRTIGKQITPYQCRIRWKHRLDPSLGEFKVGPWSEDEEEKLKEMIKGNLRIPWLKISKTLHRPYGECRYKWSTLQKNTFISGFFTENEAAIISDYLELWGESKKGIWEELSRLLNRPSYNIRQHWNHYQLKLKKEI